MRQRSSTQSFSYLMRYPFLLCSSLLLVFLLLTAVAPVSGGGIAARGFSLDVPAGPYDVAYNMYFQNYEKAHLCTLSAVVEENRNGGRDSNRTSYTYWGCTIGRESVHAHVLLPLTIEEAVYITTTTTIHGTTENGNSCNVHAAQLLLYILQNIKFSDSLAAGGIAVVLSTRNTSLSSPARTTNTRVGELRRYDMTCFLEAVKSYNEMEVGIRGTLPLITAVAFSDDQKHVFFAGCPRCNSNSSSSSSSSSSSTSQQEEELLLPREVRTAYNFVVLYFPINGSGNEWALLQQAAEMNRVKWRKGTMYPQAVLETRSGMKLAETIIGVTSVNNNNNNNKNNNNNATNITERIPQYPTNSVEASMALTYATPGCLAFPTPSCAPLGGWTVWATNANTEWEWNNGFVKKTRKGAVALLVASTAASLIHGVVPGADCPASAIVTALAAMEALRRSDTITTIHSNSNGNGDYNITKNSSTSSFDATMQDGEGRDVYVFFFPGEHAGSVGSGRFMADATWLPCANVGLENCTALAYGQHLNFTTVNFSAIDTFIVVDQVAYGAAPLFYHVDGRVSNPSTCVMDKEETAQQKAEALLESLGVQRAATSQLPYSPITTALDLFSTSANTTHIGSSPTAPEKVFLTLSRYNTTYVNPNVFTVLDQATDGNALGVEAVAEAAERLLRLLLLHTSSSSSTMTTRASNPSAVIDHDVVRELWHCFTVNIRCKYLFPQGDGNGKSTPLVPDYSVSAMLDTRRRSSGNRDSNGVLTPTQAAIEASLVRLGWPRALRSPAVSPLLRAPPRDWNGPWEYDEHWIQQQQEYSNSSRYALHVQSLWGINVGARSTMAGSQSAGLIILLSTILAASLFGFIWYGMK